MKIKGISEVNEHHIENIRVPDEIFFTDSKADMNNFKRKLLYWYTKYFNGKYKMVYKGKEKKFTGYMAVHGIISRDDWSVIKVFVFQNYLLLTNGVDVMKLYNIN